MIGCFLFISFSSVWNLFLIYSVLLSFDWLIDWLVFLMAFFRLYSLFWALFVNFWCLFDRLTERQGSAGETTLLHVPRPKKYPLNGAFVPVSLLDEVILLIHIGEAAVARDMATRAAEVESTRKFLLSYSIAMADACVIAYTRLNQLHLGLPLIERAAKLSSVSPHIWRHYAMHCVVKGDYR